MGKLSEVARARLVSAGWKPGRDVHEQVVVWRDALKAQGGFEIFPAAERVLSEFGGLDIKQGGPGITARRQSFVLDPIVGIRDRDFLRRYEKFLGVELYPIGRTFEDDMLLVVASDGRVFGVTEGVYLIGIGIVDAMDALLVGRMSKFLGGAPGA
ncbi:hypothetical protein D7X99_13865 [Corallococcus sp. AB032C]|uniref:SUKH-3 domain-containing protein n=1 Tax=Corallococcus TaxID=83461 RepID=UPI000ED9ECC8|nr:MULTISPECIES: SUKH-3 domain-containing protein [Corallococcus]NPC48128.1 SUKH-3 domain-containing protein [Corallococcus exiguus]RKH83106.1 hypothetical protein D7X99_13865 [Corallococcus sp. AB032C]